MPLTRKALALSIGISAILSAVTIAQPQKPGQADTQLVIEDATVDWFQKSEVSALREGVIDRMELRIGKEVGKKGDVIGYLHKEVADLAVEEARIQAAGQGAVMKATAQKALAFNTIQRNNSLLRRGKDLVSLEDKEKAEAEYAMADGALVEANDTLKLARAKLKSAERAAEEHIIRAPFAGQVLEEFKHEGESVRANEPVVRLGNLDTVRVWAYIPVEYAFRVKPSTKILIQPRLGALRVNKQFKGVITSVDQSIQPIAETAVRIYADLDNPDHFLKPGMKATITILLEPEGSAVLPNPTPVKSASTTPSSVGSRQVELPAFPR